MWEVLESGECPEVEVGKCEVRGERWEVCGERWEVWEVCGERWKVGGGR